MRDGLCSIPPQDRRCRIFYEFFFILNDDQFEFRIEHARGLTHKLLIANEEAPCIICETYTMCH